MIAILGLAAFALTSLLRKLHRFEPFLDRRPLGCDTCMAWWSGLLVGALYGAWLSIPWWSWQHEIACGELVAGPGYGAGAAGVCLFLLRLYARMAPDPPTQGPAVSVVD